MKLIYRAYARLRRLTTSQAPVRYGWSTAARSRVVSGFDWLEIRKRDKSTKFRISEIERVKIIDPTILRNLKIVTAKGKKRFSLSAEALEDVKVLIRYLKPDLVKHL